MPVQKSAKPASNATKPASATKTDKKVQPVSTSKAALKAAADELLAKKKPGRPPKAAATESSAPAAKRGRKPKADTAVKSAGVAEDMDMSDIEADLVGEPEAGVKPHPPRPGCYGDHPLPPPRHAPAPA